MLDAFVDRITVNQAAKELKVSLRTLYRRCKEHDILPDRDGRESYLSMVAVDILRSHQQQRGELSVRGAALERQSVQLMQREADAIELIQAIAQLLPQPQQRDVFEPQRRLQEAAASGWLLSTEQLAQVLGIAPRTVRRGGDRFGFRLERVGRWWRVFLLKS